MDKILESSLVKKWKERNKEILKRLYPHMEDSKIEVFLNKKVLDNINIQEGYLDNNYNKRRVKVDTLGIVDWINKVKPLVAGNGCFFKNQEQEINPAARMQEKFIKLRDEYKKKMYSYPMDSREFMSFHKRQFREKVNVNSFYGASGAPTSNFYNAYTAPSTTSTAQALISTTLVAFESFLGSNLKLINLDDALLVMDNILKEEVIGDTSILKDVTKEELFDNIKNSFYTYKDIYSKTLRGYINSLTQDEVNKIYYKNNIYSFSMLDHIRSFLIHVMSKVDSFKDPNKVPEVIEDDLENLWSLYREFVFYNYPIMNRIDRLKHDPRKVVHAVDTDSNIMSVDKWIKFCDKFIVPESEELSSKSPDDMRFIIINIMAFFITKMVNETLQDFCKRANMLLEYRPVISMKNEFLFTRIILAKTKKRYITSIRLKEGHDVYPEKVDIKGFDFMKSTTREETKEFFSDLAKEEILTPKEINLPKILNKLQEFGHVIEKSLASGEKHFLIPTSVKELGAYKNPYSGQGVRSVLVWNVVYPDRSIQLPEKIDMIKVKLEREEDAIGLQTSHPDVYKALLKVYRSSNKEISSKGVQVIAVPRNVKEIPEWILEYIDIETITNDNVSKFYSVLESLGVTIISHSNTKHFSNILSM